jgi:tetratricopeptide (TPR) repeat protein
MIEVGDRYMKRSATLVLALAAGLIGSLLSRYISPTSVLAQASAAPKSIAPPAPQNSPDLWAKYEKDLTMNRRSSLTHFRMGELAFEQHNFQVAANSFRAALVGDLQPKWIEVWSHLYLGKIFDATGQRDRAMNEYTQVQRTNDNTRGALDEAATYLEIPYQDCEFPRATGLWVCSSVVRSVGRQGFWVEEGLRGPESYFFVAVTLFCFAAQVGFH